MVNNSLGIVCVVAHPVDVSLDPVQDFGRLVIGDFLHNHQVTYLWDGLWMKNTLCPYLVSTLQCFFVPCFGLCINLWQQIEGKKFKLALATIVDVKIQAYVVVGKCLLSDSYCHVSICFVVNDLCEHTINEVNGFFLLLIHDFSIDFRGLNVGMSHQLACGKKVCTEREHHRSERVP